MVCIPCKSHSAEQWCRMAKRLPLPVKRSLSLTEKAYAQLRKLNETYGLGNNYLLVVILENLDDIVDPDQFDGAFQRFIADYGTPSGLPKNETP